MDCIQKDQYCTQCSLKFDNKCIYDLHIRLVHVKLKEKNTNEQQTNKSFHCEDKPKAKPNYAKQSASRQTKDEQYQRKKRLKCESYEYSCKENVDMDKHVASVHKVKKHIRCEICGYGFSQERDLNRHVLSVHEKKKAFTCEYCEYQMTLKIFRLSCTFNQRCIFNH